MIEMFRTNGTIKFNRIEFFLNTKVYFLTNQDCSTTWTIFTLTYLKLNEAFLAVRSIAFTAFFRAPDNISANKANKKGVKGNFSFYDRVRIKAELGGKTFGVLHCSHNLLESCSTILRDFLFCRLRLRFDH